MSVTLAGASPRDAGSAAGDDLDLAWRASQRRLRLRRRIMPLAGGAGLLFIWWALIAVFHVRPFIAPSPEVVALTVYKSSVC